MNPFNQTKLAYKILPEYQLIIELYYGPIKLADILELKKTEIEDKDYNSGFNFLVIIDQADMLLTESDYKTYVDAIKTDSRIVAKRRSALLTDTPRQVVSMYFYEQAARELPIVFNTFSTLDSALLWIGIQVDLVSNLKAEIERIIKLVTEDKAI